MNQNKTESEPPSVEEPRDEGLDATPCSASSNTPETPETDLEVKLRSYRFCDAPDANIYINADHANKLERQRNAALDALDKIESHYVDGDDTYEAWKAMGEIAATFLAENDLERQPAPTQNDDT